MVFPYQFPIYAGLHVSDVTTYARRLSTDACQPENSQVLTGKGP